MLAGRLACTIQSRIARPGRRRGTGASFVRLQVKAYGDDGRSLQGYAGGWGANKQGDIFFDGGACVAVHHCVQPM